MACTVGCTKASIQVERDGWRVQTSAAAIGFEQLQHGALLRSSQDCTLKKEATERARGSRAADRGHIQGTIYRTEAISSLDYGTAQCPIVHSLKTPPRGRGPANVPINHKGHQPTAFVAFLLELEEVSSPIRFHRWPPMHIFKNSVCVTSEKTAPFNQPTNHRLRVPHAELHSSCCKCRIVLSKTVYFKTRHRDDVVSLVIAVEGGRNLGSESVVESHFHFKLAKWSRG